MKDLRRSDDRRASRAHAHATRSWARLHWKADHGGTLRDAHCHAARCHCCCCLTCHTCKIYPESHPQSPSCDPAELTALHAEPFDDRRRPHRSPNRLSALPLSEGRSTATCVRPRKPILACAAQATVAIVNRTTVSAAPPCRASRRC
jgi:hypothetical protein